MPRERAMLESWSLLDSLRCSVTFPSMMELIMPGWSSEYCVEIIVCSVMFETWRARASFFNSWLNAAALKLTFRLRCVAENKSEELLKEISLLMWLIGDYNSLPSPSIGSTLE